MTGAVIHAFGPRAERRRADFPGPFDRNVLLAETELALHDHHQRLLIGECAEQGGEIGGLNQEVIC